MTAAPTSYTAFLELFTTHGETDADYLATHWRRFLSTRSLFAQHWSPQRGKRLLDIGAHWLHLSVLLADAGYQVTAAEFADHWQRESLRSLARAHQIDLLGHGNLDQEDVFAELASDSIDVIVLCEVLEHMAFNPLTFWHSVYRVMAPGGRILLTTPNVYFWKSRIRGALQFLAGSGTGVSIEQIFSQPTYAHHWKEYSARELRRYFGVLSPDFKMHRLFSIANHLTHVGIAGRTLYAEIDLLHKNHGIVASPANV